MEADAFSALFSHFAPSARTFFTGNLCANVGFDNGEERGYLHVLRSGAVRMTGFAAGEVALEQPSLILSPRRLAHRFFPGASQGADLVCATIDIGGGQSPIAAALPDLLIVPIADTPTVAPTLDLMFDEAFSERDGRQVALDRLFEYLLVQMIRHVVATGAVAKGALAALGDTRLARVVTAMHEAPGRDWSLETLAAEAGMSRTRFAEAFRKTVGATPMEYLTQWRMAVAQALLRRGKSMKSAAAAVGYDSQAAFTRAFAKHVGMSPKAWLRDAEAPRQPATAPVFPLS